MKIFIDTANIDDIKKAATMGIISGVTTNPSLIAKEKRDFIQTIKEITEIVDGPISAEVISPEADKMVEEAKKLSSIHPNVVIKIPFTDQGLEATHTLSSIGIKTNLTLIFSAAQALLAYRAGASFVSPFAGRVDDIAGNGMDLIGQISRIFRLHNVQTEIIAASIRSPLHLVQAAEAGAHIATVPYNVIMQSIHHPLTVAGVEKFMQDWKSVTDDK